MQSEVFYYVTGQKYERLKNTEYVAIKVDQLWPSSLMDMAIRYGESLLT